MAERYGNMVCELLACPMFGVAAPRELIAWVEEADVGGFNLAACLLRQQRLARHIGGEDHGEAAGLAHSVSPAARRRPERKSSRWSGFR